MANRYLQLKRNAVVAESLAAAQAKLNESDFLADKLDGELVVARYKIDPQGGVEQSNVGIVEGHVYSKDGVKFVIFIDSESGKEALDNLKEYVGQTESEKLSANTAGHTYVSASTNVTDALNDLSDNLDHAMSEIGLTSGDTIENHVGDTYYISGATTVISALTILDGTIAELSGDSDNLRVLVGVDKDATAITNYVSASTYISGETTVMGALNKLDDKSASALTVEQITKTGQYNDSDSDKYETTLTLNDGTELSDDVQLRYTAWSPASLPVPKSIGDIEQGTLASELNGKTISELLDAIIFKTVYPTITNWGSASLTNASLGATNQVKKAGNTISGSVETTDFTTTLNRGNWKIQDGVEEHEANHLLLAAATSTTLEYKYDRANSSNVADPNLQTKVTGVYSTYTTNLTNLEPGIYTFRGTAYYPENTDAPLYDSKGVSNNPQKYFSGDSAFTEEIISTVANPIVAGSKNSTYVVNISLPLYATSGTNASTEGLTELSLKSWAAQGTATGDTTGWVLDFPSCSNTVGNRRIIDSPRKIKYYEANLAGKLLNDASNKFTLLEGADNLVEKTIGGKTYKYYRYIWTGGAAGTNQGRIITL